MAHPKYDPLRRHLLALPRNSAAMAFSEVEEVLGFCLPRSAREHAAAWWSNEPETHVQARAWMDAGWRVEGVSKAEEKVYFHLKECGLAEPPGVSDVTTPFVRNEPVIVVQKSSLRGSAMRLLEDYCEENGGTIADAIAATLNAVALERRRQLIDWFQTNSPPAGGDSTGIIREDRDAR